MNGTGFFIMAFGCLAWFVFGLWIGRRSMMRIRTRAAGLIKSALAYRDQPYSETEANLFDECDRYQKEARRTQARGLL